MNDASGLWVWHVRHEKLMERLDESRIENRIAYIKHTKPRREVATRLRLLNVCVDQAALDAADSAFVAAVDSADSAYDAVVASARSAYDAAVKTVHDRECTNCPWNGKTIFPGSR